MTILSFFSFLILMAAGALGLQFAMRLRSLRAASPLNVPVNLDGRYRPMLRLLSEEDLAVAAGNPSLVRKLRSERRRLFRGYLHCVERDYGRLLAGIRMAMVQAHTDRRDLARALARNRAL